MLQSRLLKSGFVRFGIVGSVGFVVNAVLLSIFFRLLNVPILAAQLLSAEGALMVTFLLHHKWTYVALAAESWQQRLGAFHGSTWVGIVLNSLIVTCMVSIGHIHYLVSLAVASVIVLFWNFYWAHYHIWRKKSDSPSDGR